VSISGAFTYLLPEPYETALKILRRALADGGIEVVEVLDLSRTIRGMLGVEMHGCTVLCISADKDLHALAATTGLLPLHVAIAPRGRHAEVHVLAPLQQVETLPSAAMAPVIAIQARLSQVLDRIAMRESGYTSAGRV